MTNRVRYPVIRFTSYMHGICQMEEIKCVRLHDSLISSAVFKIQNFQTPLKQKLTAYQPRFSISDLNIDDDPLTVPSTIQRLKRSFIDRQARQKCSKVTTFLASDSPKSQESFSSVISECSEDDEIDELLG